MQTTLKQPLWLGMQGLLLVGLAKYNLHFVAEESGLEMTW